VVPTISPNRKADQISGSAFYASYIASCSNSA
jgi:hypothetical protein